MTHEFTLRTKYRSEFVDITSVIQDIISKQKVKNGICHIYIPHTTAGITINENADPDVISDIIASLDKLIPLKNNYKHMEGNSAAHIKASLMGSSQNLGFENGKLILGTWQGVFFTEFDGPRTRKVYLKISE
ncbi:secondary thiamine-phosphate synthase enzyme YjbQ [Elusimicrobiota bacterium]